MSEFGDSISRSNCMAGSAPAPANRTAVRILRVNEAPEAAHRLAAELISRQHPTPLLQREATTLPSLGEAVHAALGRLHHAPLRRGQLAFPALLEWHGLRPTRGYLVRQHSLISVTGDELGQSLSKAQPRCGQRRTVRSSPRTSLRRRRHSSADPR